MNVDAVSTTSSVWSRLLELVITLTGIDTKPQS